MTRDLDPSVPFAFIGEISREFFRPMLYQQIMWNDCHRHLIFRTLSQLALSDMSNVSTRMMYSNATRHKM
ncbi:hypothetical protein QRQ56_35140 [Bradyrhizobium sp. U531]|uniref:hypothetical protein n=1 Tax=Bradyrhizobium sp. U531 TaxID=3053458 RepID=UPI003F43E162